MYKRQEMVNSGKIAYSASAKQAYQTEVDSLMGKLNVALKNAPRERQAQTMANSIAVSYTHLDVYKRQQKYKF